MLENVQNITSDGLTRVFSRRQTNTPATLGRFISAAGDLVLEIRQKATRNRKRHECVFTYVKEIPGVTAGTLVPISMSGGFYIDEPNNGFADSEHLIIRNMLFTFANNPSVMSALSNDDN